MRAVRIRPRREPFKDSPLAIGCAGSCTFDYGAVLASGCAGSCAFGYGLWAVLACGCAGSCVFDYDVGHEAHPRIHELPGLAPNT